MDKRLLIAWGVIFVAWLVGSWLIHALLLINDYNELPNLMRTGVDTTQYLPFMLAAHVIMAGAFVWIYSQGVAAKPWLHQGLRFGVAVALLTAVPTYLIYYTVQPLPGMLVVKQIVLGAIHVVILGVIVGFLYKQASPAPATAAAAQPAP